MWQNNTDMPLSVELQMTHQLCKSPLQQKICSDHYKTQQAFIQPAVNERFSSLCHSMTHVWTDTRTSDLSFKYENPMFPPIVGRTSVCVLLTISAVWFLVRTALWRAVMPSLVLKSRWAPPFFRTFMSSAQPSSCDAIVNGHSAHTETTVDFFGAYVLNFKGASCEIQMETFRRIFMLLVTGLGQHDNIRIFILG